MPQNIVICYFSIAGNSKYQDLANAFCDLGNNVLQINTYQLANDIISQKFYEFNPTVVISCNNSLPSDIFCQVKCPILIFDADTPKFFSDKDNLVNNYKNDNVYFLLYQSKSKDLYRDLLGIHIEDGKSMLFPPATNFSSNKESKLYKNISFIGSSFLLPGSFVSLLHEQKNYLNILKKVEDDYFCFDDEDVDQSIRDIASNHYPFLDRVSYLNVISDLGLNIYSNTDWRKELSLIFPEVAKCYIDTKIETKEGNENVYNSSKISINLSHPQALNSFSWRVPDIMASNSCLIVEDKPDWHEIFGKYISKEVKSSIIYNDRFEMRDKCIKLLKDEELRLRCVKECQEAIEKNGRWIHRIRDIQKLLGIKLENANFEGGRINDIFDIIASRKLCKIENDGASIARSTDVSIARSTKCILKTAVNNSLLSYIIKYNLCILFIAIYHTPVIGKRIMSKERYLKYRKLYAEKGVNISSKDIYSLARNKRIKNKGVKKKKTKFLFILLFIHLIPLVGKLLISKRNIHKKLKKQDDSKGGL